MLRFLLISISTLAVLGTAFFLLVLRAQPAAQINSTTQTALRPTPLSDVKSQAGIGPGKNPSLLNYDEHGVLASKFTADDFTPTENNSFLVKNPVAIYYLARGQWMKVTGDTGKVYCDTTGPGQSSSMLAAPTGTPRNGTLHHVRVELYPSADATGPSQWMETDNIRFDNDTYRMYTESFVDDAGQTILADQVPVSIRGEQYEFDGKGLTMVWNGISHRLEKLEIAHGRRLEIKDTTKLALPGMTAPEPAKTSVMNSTVPGDLLSDGQGRGVLSEMTVHRSAVGSTGGRRSGAPVRLISDTKPVAKVDPPTPYRAIFHDQVQIKDPARTLAVADVMTVDFLQGSAKAAGPVPAGPVPAVPAPAASAPVASDPVASAPAAVHAMPATASVSAITPVVPATARSPLPASQPATTKPTTGPITIYWTGPLIVQPIKANPILPLAPGQSIVKLVGKPVQLTPEGSLVKTAEAIYRNPDGAAQLLNSPEFPVVHIEQDKGLRLDTAGIDYDPAHSVAYLNGPNVLTVPVATKAMNVTWQGPGVLHVVRIPTQPNGVDQVNLAGDVHVTHPIFTLDSDRLALNLDLLPKPGAKPTDGDEQLRKLTANQDVHCRLIHNGTPDEGIDGNQLVIKTERAADNRTIPREVIADGNVTAFDPGQSLTADHLDALLVPKPAVMLTAKPATKPADEDVAGSVDLDSLEANTNNVSTLVHALLKGGATADAKQLHITTIDGRKHVELSGEGGVKLDNQKGTWLTGPLVSITPDDSGLTVHGPGKIQTIRTPSSTQPANATKPNPIDVTWAKSMSLRGDKNIADVYGNVIVTNIDAAGTNSSLRGDNAHIDLMDAPKPAHDDRKNPTTQPDAFGSSMGGKQVKMLTLAGNVIGDSTLRGPDHLLERQSNLYGDTLIYNAIGSTVTIPGPGKLLMENHRTDDKPGSGNRGNLAISWASKLTYDQNTQQIFIDGNTVVGFERDAARASKSPPPSPMQLRSQHLIITLEKSPGSGKGDNKLQLSRMNAKQNVRFNAQGANLACDQVDYNPKDETMTATGHGRTVDASQNITGTFGALVYDTRNEEIKHVENSQVKVQR